MIILSLIGWCYDIGISHADKKSKENILPEGKEFQSLDVRGKKLSTETFL